MVLAGQSKLGLPLPYPMVSTLPCTPNQYVPPLDHLAFYRAWMEGTFDLVNLAKRYLRDDIGRPEAKRILRAVQDSLVLAARRSGKHGQARLLLLDKTTLAGNSAPSQENGGSSNPASIPSFDDYLAANDPNGDFQIDEMWELYQQNVVLPAKFVAKAEGHTNADKECRRQARNGRLAQLRLQLISEISAALSRPPLRTDALEDWLGATTVARLNSVGVDTIEQLVAFINANGFAWYNNVPRLGHLGAARIQQWLQCNQDAMGLALHERVTTAPHEIRRREAQEVDGTSVAMPNGLARNVPPRPERQTPDPFLPAVGGGATSPLPALITSEQFDGSQGLNRAKPEENRTRAANDHEAIQSWLAQYTAPEHRHTLRSYRTAAERLLYWCIVEKQLALSSLVAEDLEQFRQFLLNPLPRSRWVSDRVYRRADPRWRPFVQRRTTIAQAQGAHGVDSRNAGLSPRSAGQVMSILAGMFTWLMNQRYLSYSPFSGLSLRPTTAVRIDVDRSLTRRQWSYLLGELSRLPESDIKTHRLRFAFHLAYSTGMRLHEMAKASTDDLERREFEDGRRPLFLNVLGKGNKLRRVALSAALQRTFSLYLESRLLGPDPMALKGRSIPLIAKLHGSQGTWFLSESALYKIFVDFFAWAADRLPNQDSEVGQEDRRKLLRASTHWLRHTYGSHAAAKGTNLSVIQRNMGHASLSTTSIYIRPEDELQVSEAEKFDNVSFGDGGMAEHR